MKNNYFFKRIFLLLFVVIACILTIFHINYTSKENTFKQEQWAYENKGQKIEGIAGKKGIDINIEKYYNTAKGNNVLIAVIDTGIDTSCTRLKGSIWCDGKYNWDFYNNDSTIYDSYLYDYHGTYITNTILEVAPDVKILPIKFMRGTSGSIEDANKAIKYACEQGADIINCSWNFSEFNQEMYDIIAQNSDILFVCSTGNANSNLDEVLTYPACYDLNNIIVVAAIDNCGNIYTSSGYGMNNVDVAAPGVNILVTLPEDDSGYISGSSISTAFVSGLSAKILSANNSLTAEQVKDVIINHCTKVKLLSNRCKSGGIINISSSIDYLFDSMN